MSTKNSDLINASGSNFTQSLLRKESPQECYEDEVVSNLRATGIEDKKSVALGRWTSNESRYPNIAPVTREDIAMNVSSLCSGECFSVAGNTAENHGTRIYHNYIRIRMFLRSWTSLLRATASEK